MKKFYEHVYQRFIAKLIKVFDFKSQLLSTLSFIDPARVSMFHQPYLTELKKLFAFVLTKVLRNWNIENS